MNIGFNVHVHDVVCFNRYTPDGKGSQQEWTY